MKGKFFSVGTMLVTAFALCVAASAQVPGQLKLRGEINDYTPSTTGGPWEMHGEWSLHVLRQVDGGPQIANFSAEVDMERSDQGVMLNGDDFTMPADRHAHTHHITMRGQVTKNLLDKNNNVIGFEVTGVATITGNGGAPPDFDPYANVTIDVTGGSLVKYSNLKLTFGASPSNPPAHNASAVDHFGSFPLNGVVKRED